MSTRLTCPRCGSRDICTAGRGEHQTEYGLHCSSCGHEGWGETMDAAIRQWETEVQYEANPVLLRAAPEMLRALEAIKGKLEAYDPTCPFCQGNASSGHRYTCIWHIANAAIRKARGLA